MVAMSGGGSGSSSGVGQMIEAGDVIEEQLVTFKDIMELQNKNR